MVFFNITISISGAVFGETQENWQAEDLQIKNELVLYCEQIYIWNWKNDSQNERKHIIYVEADEDHPSEKMQE